LTWIDDAPSTCSDANGHARVAPAAAVNWRGSLVLIREQPARLIGPRRVDLLTILGCIAAVVVILLLRVGLCIVETSGAARRRIARHVRAAVRRIDVAVVGLLHLGLLRLGPRERRNLAGLRQRCDLAGWR